jgi:hypothetical protein
MRSRNALAGVLVAVIVAGCGGGGGGDPANAAPATFSFPPPSATTFAAPGVFQYAVSGDCTGAEVHLRGAGVPATFSGQSATAVSTTVDRIWVNCAAAGSVSALHVAYYDANFAYLGQGNAPGPAGSVWVADAPWSVPATLKVGDAGTYGSSTLYSDSSRTTVIGRDVHTYLVQASTGTTALLVLSAEYKDASGNLLYSTKETHQLQQGAAPVLVSVEYQYVTPNPMHLVYTPAAAALTLSAGTSVTLGPGQMLLVPAGTTVTANGGTSSLQNHLGTITTSAGSVVAVPANASGPADNVVMVR